MAHGDENRPPKPWIRTRGPVPTLFLCAGPAAPAITLSARLQNEPRIRRIFSGSGPLTFSLNREEHAGRMQYMECGSLTRFCSKRRRPPSPTNRGPQQSELTTQAAAARNSSPWYLRINLQWHT